MAVDYVGSAEEAARLLVNLMDTPKLRSLRFTFMADVNGVPTVDYRVERFVYPEKIEPVLDEHGNQTGEFKKVKAADY